MVSPGMPFPNKNWSKVLIKLQFLGHQVIEDLAKCLLGRRPRFKKTWPVDPVGSQASVDPAQCLFAVFPEDLACIPCRVSGQC